MAGLATGLVVVSAAFADNLALSLPQAADDPVKLSLPDGFVAEPAEVLQVFVGSAEECCDDRIPVAGGYVVEKDLLIFTPTFGFSAGTAYVARVQVAQSEELTPFGIAADTSAAPAAVTRIYPSGDVLPENTLRFYIHFSAPMMPGVAFDYIKLRDASGKVDDAALMQFRQELWNEDRTRLTVLIDPGRIKRDLTTNRRLGPALAAGERYSLAVDAGWSSADGTSALSTFTKTFQVTDALRSRPAANLWIANAPCSGTREPLTVTLDRPFDRHLLTRALRLETDRNDRIQGATEIIGAEDEWRFTPFEPWPSEDLLVLADPALEDVAGNNFFDLLDHISDSKQSEASTTVLPIKIRNCAG